MSDCERCGGPIILDHDVCRACIDAELAALREVADAARAHVEWFDDSAGADHENDRLDDLRAALAALAAPAPSLPVSGTSDGCLPGDRRLLCAHCDKETPHRYRPSPEAGPFWRCSECGEPYEPLYKRVSPSSPAPPAQAPSDGERGGTR